MSKINYYFTFCNDHPKYKHIYCKVSVDEDLDDTYSKAREKFVSKFGIRWGNQYDEEQVIAHKNEQWWKDFGIKIIDIDSLPFVEPDPNKFAENRASIFNSISVYLKSTLMVDPLLHSVITSKVMMIKDEDYITILDHNWKNLKKFPTKSDNDMLQICDAEDFIDSIGNQIVEDILSSKFTYSISSRVSARSFYNMISNLMSFKLTNKYVTLPQLVVTVYQIVNLSPDEILKDLVNKYNELKSL